MSKHLIREHLPLVRQHEPHFRWRGREVSRIEGFADAVFAFAVTLLIVALEVPHDFEGLMSALRGFPAFVVSFTLLMLFWNAHYHYFRRYGLEDPFTRLVSLGILLLVLFSVYPLKFLFSVVLQFGSSHASHIETLDQLRTLYTVYGLGFAGLWTLYALLYRHALKLGKELELTGVEVLLTEGVLSGFYINIAVCLLSVVLARTADSSSLPGNIYLLLAPAIWFTRYRHGRRVRALLKK